MFYARFGKRVLDLALTIPAMVVFAPIIAILSLIVRWQMGRPIFFTQLRPGLRGRVFRLIKFRTMTTAVDTEGKLLPDAQRLTGAGAFLRKTSLDELPELFNVIKGDMSLVGPRPLLVEYLPRYTPEQSRRHNVRPGITGWAQINGRQSVLFSKRLALDVWYVDHLSLWLDLKILLLTLPRAFSSSGVILGQSVTEVDDLGLSLSASGVVDGRD